MRVLWFAESVTAYNSYLFNILGGIRDIKLFVFYRFRSDPLHSFSKEDKQSQNYKLKTNQKICTVLLKSFINSDFIIFTGIKGFNKKLIIVLSILFNKKYAYWTDTPPNDYFKGAKGILKKYLLIILFKRSKYFCSTGVNGLNFFKQNGFTTDKLINLPFFWDLEIPDLEKDKKTELDNYFKKFVNDSDFVILMSGKLIKSKRYNMAIELANEIKNVRNIKNIKFLHCGEGPERKSLEEMISKYRLESNFYLLGWLNDEYLDNFHKLGSVFLHPAKFDPYPTVVLKAMIYSLPVIGFSGSGSIADRVISNYNGFLLLEDSANEMLEKIMDLYQDSNKRKSFRDNSRKTAELWDKNKAISIISGIIYN